MSYDPIWCSCPPKKRILKYGGDCKLMCARCGFWINENEKPPEPKPSLIQRIREGKL